MQLVVYGIPSCGTVKKARAWLGALPHRFVDLRASPPSPTQVARWVEAFGVDAMKNTSGGAYRALGAEKDGWTAEVWTARFAVDPMLIRRPIIERDGAPVCVGFRGTDAALRSRVLGT